MSTKDTDYRALSAELDAIMNDLETADLDIEQAIAKYERGSEIVKQLETYLATAENKVTKIKARWEAELPKD